MMKKILLFVFGALLLAAAFVQDVPAAERSAKKHAVYDKTGEEHAADEDAEDEATEDEATGDKHFLDEVLKERLLLEQQPLDELLLEKQPLDPLPPEERPFQREIRFGHLALIPSMSMEQVHNDNIYFGNGRNKTTELKESDWIRHFKPGLLLDWELNGRGSFKLGYSGDFARYSKNSFNDWRTNKYLIDLDYFTPGGLIVKIKNLLVDAQDPYGAPNEFGLGRKTMRWTDRCSVAAGFKFSEDFKLLGLYNFYKQRYADRVDFVQNYTSTEAGAGAEVRLAEKTWLFLRAYSGRQNYDTHRRGVSNSNDASYGWKKVTTGLTWDSEARFEGEVNIGYQWNTYENSADRRWAPYKDKSTWVANTVVRFLQSDSRSFYLTFTRDMRQLSAGQNGFFTSTTAGLGLRQQMTPRILLLAGCSYTKNQYISIYSAYKRRKDPIRMVRASLNYLLSDRVSVGIGYSQLANGSDREAGRYRVNQLSFLLDINPVFLGRRPRSLLSGQE